MLLNLDLLVQLAGHPGQLFDLGKPQTITGYNIAAALLQSCFASYLQAQNDDNSSSAMHSLLLSASCVTGFISTCLLCSVH